MSLAGELAELRQQKLAGAITPEQYELRRNAKLDDVDRYYPSERKFQPEVIEGTVSDVARQRGGAVAILDGGLVMLTPQDANAMKLGDRIVAAGLPMNQCLQAGVLVMHHGGVWHAGWFDWALFAATLLAGRSSSP